MITVAKSAPKPNGKTSGRNPDRRNGKAWKKGGDGVSAPPEKRVVNRKVKTFDRARKDEMIRMERNRRREFSITQSLSRKGAKAEVEAHAKEERKNGGISPKKISDIEVKLALLLNQV